MVIIDKLPAGVVVHNFSGYSNTDSIVGQILGYNRVSTNGNIITDVHLTKKFGARADIDTVPNDRDMPILAAAGFTDRNPLGKIAELADNGTMGNDDLTKVADIQPSPNPRIKRNIYARRDLNELLQNGQERQKESNHRADSLFITHAPRSHTINDKSPDPLS